jgi:hypothetical protein
MITNQEEYINSLLAEIERLKNSNKNTLYRINDSLSDNVVGYIKMYFETTPGYILSMKKCARCKNQWDIIITFSL